MQLIDVWVMYRDKRDESNPNTCSVSGLMPYGANFKQSHRWLWDKRIYSIDNQYNKFKDLPPDQPYKVKLLMDKYFI